MDALRDVVQVLDEVLSLNGRGASFTAQTRLLGAIPEFDSMAVVALLTALEDRYGFAVDDDEVDADVFATVGTLTQFVEQKIAG